MSAARRVLALARFEARLTRRDKVQMSSVVGVPVLAAAVLALADPVGPAAVAVLVALLLLFVVYYNLLTAYVARREELVLKRLRTGECSDGEVLTGMALPAVLVATVQVVLLVAGAAVLLDLPVPVNAPLVVLGVLIGSVVLAALALLTAPWTRTTVATQLTALPVMTVCVLGAGVALPLDALPDVVGQVGRFLPMTPVVELVNLGWLGSVDGGPAGDLLSTTQDAVLPLAVALVWAVLGVLAARRWFTWEPRS